MEVESKGLNHFYERLYLSVTNVYVTILFAVRAIVFGFHLQVFNLHPKVSMLFLIILFWRPVVTIIDF